MEYLLLSEIKKHLVIEHNEDDALLRMYGDAVEAFMPKMLGQPLDHYTDDAGNLPADIKAAMLICVADLYAHRESQTAYQLHPTGALEALLAHHVVHKM